MPDPQPPTLRNGRYVVVGVLGEGSQGDTFEAVDKREGRAVAIKRFQVRGAKSWKEVELAEREARVLASIAHPALPTYVEHFEEEGCLYLVMEKIEGEQLSRWRHRGKGFSRSDVVRLLRAAAEVLDYLHGRSPPLIHRDIKPGNILRRPDGSYAFVDFGAVRDSLRPEGGSTVVGTFGYMAPEQFQSRAMPATDVYAVGATALALLTGREPEDLPHQGLGIDVAAALQGLHDPGMVRVLSAMLVPDPDQRAPRIGPLLDALEGAAPETHPRPPPPRPPPARPRRPRGSGPLVLTLLALTVARLATFAVLRVALPLLLTLLSVALGPGLRRAAFRVDRAGRRGDERIREAVRRVQSHGDAANAHRRVRVDEELEWEEDHEAPRVSRRR
jgi:serine/threonine protein kinase